MTIDKVKAFETPDGLILNEAAGLFSGSASPVGEDAPIGTHYFQTAGLGSLWKKFGAGVNDWIEYEFGKPRYVAVAGFAGNTPNNTWLQWFRSNPSNTVPFPIAEASKVVALALATSVATTGTLTLYKNGSPIVGGAISLAAQAYNTVTGLSLALSPNDLLSARITSGSANSPNFYVSVKVD